MIKTIRFLGRQHEAQYTRVLQRAFTNSDKFIAHPATWSWPQDQNPNLGVFHDSTLISVMKMDRISTPEERSFKLHTDLPLTNLTLPFMYLNKAGTLPEFEGIGLNSLLRYHFIGMARQAGASFLVGTMIKDSPRVRIMKEIGYEFLPNNKKWDGYFISDELPLIGFLDLQKNGESALKKLSENLGSLLSEYRLIENSPIADDPSR